MLHSESDNQTSMVEAPIRASRPDIYAELDALRHELTRTQVEMQRQLTEMRRTTYPTLLTTAQVENLLCISNTTRRELTSRGELPAVYIDARPRFRLSDVEALIERKSQ